MPKKTGRKSTGTSRKKRSGATKKNISVRRRERRNQNWAFVLLFVALMALLAVFGVKAPVIDFIRQSTKIIGAGFFVLPFSLILAAVILFVSPGGKAAFRVLCALVWPVLLGCLVHSLAGTNEFSFTKTGFFDMLDNGGLICGYLTAMSIKYISRIAAFILFLILNIMTLLNAFNLTMAYAYRAIKKFISKIIAAREYTDEDDYYEEEEEIEKPLIRLPKRRRPVIDVPLGGEIIIQDNTAAPEKLIEAPVINLKPAAVKTPAEVAQNIETNGDPAAQESVRINPDNFTQDADKPAKKQESAADEKEPEQQKAFYNYPPLSLLKSAVKNTRLETPEALKANAQKLIESIRSFGIEAQIINIVRGPSVTRYEIQLDPGIKLSRITALSDDIALALGASGVYIAPIPDRSLIGIEVPNKTVQLVHLSEVIASEEFTASKSNLTFAMGKDISGNCMVCDIFRMPHLLIAGTTGSGKSVCMNSIIVSLLYKSTPEQVRLIMIDPKMVELGVYNGIPHLLVPVVTDPRKASGALQWAVYEMMKRYRLFAERNVRDIQTYNRAVSRTGEAEPLSQIVIVIDELSDLMVVARKDVEDSIMRLTQMARAAGMHLVIATQRPSVDVITGVIKSNIPSRIAFAVASKIESNIILGSVGAEKLIGRGDMLFAPIGATKPTRIQGCFISGDEVEAVVNHVKQYGAEDYSEEVIEQIERNAEKSTREDSADMAVDSDADELLDEAIDIVVEMGQASVSMLQRRLKLGYSRAARIVDQMEERGIVGAFEGAKPRQILITREQWNEIKSRRESI